MPASRSNGALRTTIEKKAVAPLMRRYARAAKPNGELPEVVVQNRVHRASERLREALVSRGSARLSPELKRRLDSLVQDWAAKLFEDGFAAVQEFEIRCAREHDLVAALESGDPERVLRVREKEYRERVVREFGFIELRGIQVSHRVTSELDKVYVPLHLEEGLREAAAEGQLPLWPARMAAPEVLRRERSIVIVGAPGSGKSTLVAYLASGLAEGSRKQLFPMVLAVRTLREGTLTLRSLCRQLDLDETLATKALDEMRVVLFVDGLDEAPGALRQKLTSSLNRFTREHKGLRVIVTTRPAGAPGEVEKCLDGFRQYRLTDLTREEVDEFIDKWCLAAETSVRKDVSEARKEAAKAAEDLKSRVGRSRPVQRIAVNPLLTTILCVVHRFGGRTIPEHRVTLYQKCTDALLYEWDRAKFPEGAAVGELDAEQKRTLLRGVAAALHEKHEAEMPEDEVIRHFAKVLPDLGKSKLEAKSIVQDIRDRSGVLAERRPGYFGFSHLTFQEYLTALDYVQRKQLEGLADRYEDPWWQEVIQLAAGAPGSEATLIVRRLLAKGNDAATVVAAGCVETAIDLPVAVREEIDRKLQTILPPRTFEGMDRLVKLGITVAPLLVRILPSVESNAKLWVMATLRSINYEPAIPVIRSQTRDATPSDLVLPSGYLASVGELAVVTLFLMAWSSDVAKRAFASETQRPHNPEFLTVLREWNPPPSVLDPQRWLELAEIIDAALKAARPGKQCSTLEESTA